MSEMNEQLRMTESLMPYEALLEAAEAISRMSVVLCPEVSCKRSATIERQLNGSTITRYHAEGQLDSVAALLKNMKTERYASGRIIITPCPAHSDYYSKRLVEMGVVMGPEETRSAEEVYKAIGSRQPSAF